MKAGLKIGQKGKSFDNLCDLLRRFLIIPPPPPPPQPQPDKRSFRSLVTQGFRDMLERSTTQVYLRRWTVLLAVKLLRSLLHCGYDCLRLAGHLLGSVLSAIARMIESDGNQP